METRVSLVCGALALGVVAFWLWSANGPRSVDPLDLPPRSSEAEAIGESLQPDPSEAERSLVPTGIEEATTGPTVSIYGRVVSDATGEPIRGALVSGFGVDPVRSGPSGEFRIPDRPVGRSGRLVAIQKGYAKGEVTVRITEAEDVRADIRMKLAAIVTVRVVDRDTRTPIPGAVIVDRRPGELATTDEQGECTFDMAEGEFRYLEIRASGYFLLNWHWRLESLADQPEGIVEVPMLRQAWIAGTVRGPDGKPFPGADIAIGAIEDYNRQVAMTVPHGTIPGAAFYSTEGWFGKTDEQGRFQQDIIPGDASYRVVASHPEFARSVVTPVVLERGSTWVELSLQPAAGIEGRVTLNGQPWSGRVSWTGESADQSGRVETSEDGTYSLQSVSAGNVQIRARDEDLGLQHEARIQVAAGDMIQHDITWGLEFSSITGRVTSDSGVPLAGVSIRATCQEGGGCEWSAKTDSEGAYSVEVRTPHTYELSAEKLAVRSHPDIQAGASGVDFVLPTAGTLRLRVLDAETGADIKMLGSFSSSEIQWRETGTEKYRRTRWRDQRNRRAYEDGVATFELPTGAVDLVISFRRSGYAPLLVSGIPVSTLENPQPAVIELQRGIDVTLAFEPVIRRAVRGSRRLLFLLEASELNGVSGPYPGWIPPANNSYDDIIYYRKPGLLGEMITGSTTVRGLVPGTYHFRALPPELVFEPESFEVTSETDTVTIRWREK